MKLVRGVPIFPCNTTAVALLPLPICSVLKFAESVDDTVTVALSITTSVVLVGTNPISQLPAWFHDPDAPPVHVAVTALAGGAKKSFQPTVK